MTPRNPRTTRVAVMRAKTELLKSRAPQQTNTNEETAVEPPATTHYYKTPTVSGPVQLRVGGATFGVPEGSRTAVRRGTHGAMLGAVEAPDGSVHLLDETKGEAVLNNDTVGAVRALLLTAESARSKYKYRAPTISGTGMILSLGTASWRLDHGTRVHHVNAQTAAVLVDGVVHLLQANARGVVREIVIPEKFRAEMVTRYFPATHKTEPAAYGVLPPGPTHK